MNSINGVRGAVLEYQTGKVIFGMYDVTSPYFRINIACAACVNVPMPHP